MTESLKGEDQPEFRLGSDTPFLIGLGILGGSYAIIILAMIVADLAYLDKDSMLGALRSQEIHYSIVLSLLSCTLSTILSLWVAVPLGYLTPRFDFPGKRLLEIVLDIPIVLPFGHWDLPLGSLQFRPLFLDKPMGGLRNSRRHPCSIHGSLRFCHEGHENILRPSSATL